MADIRDVIEAFIAPSIVEEIAKQYHPYEVGWLQDKALRLGRISDRPDLEYRAYVIPGETINAFSIPGPNVYLYEGVLAHFKEPAVCGILGHEIAHAALRHPMNAVIAAYGTEFLTGLLNQGRPRELAELVLTIIWRGYGRSNEFTADKYSVHYNQKANLWPYGMRYFLEWLMSVEERPTDRISEIIANLLATHPAVTERLEAVNTELATLGIIEKSYTWEKIKKYLPYVMPLGIGGIIAGALIYKAKRK